jgi:hypothetical protein
MDTIRKERIVIARKYGSNRTENEWLSLYVERVGALSEERARDHTVQQPIGDFSYFPEAHRI